MNSMDMEGALSNKKILVLLFFLLLVIHIGFRTYAINKPFIGYHAFAGAFFSTIARNYVRYGYVRTKFAPALLCVSKSPIEFFYHLKHPPLLSLMVSVAFQIFGIKEWAARLVPILFSSGIFLFLFLIVKKIFSLRVAFLTILFLPFLPMEAYFGKTVFYGPICLFFCLLSVFFYFDFIRGKKFCLIPFFLSFILAGLTEWTSYFLITFLWLHYIFFVYKKKKDSILPIVSFPVVGVLVLAFIILWFGYILGGVSRYFQLMLDAFDLRAGSGGILLIEWIQRQILWSKSFTCILVALSFMGLVISLVEIFRKDEKNRFKYSFITLFLLFGLPDILLFREGSYKHEFSQYYLVPFILISSSIALDSIFKKVLRSNKYLICLATTFVFGLFIISAYPRFLNMHNSQEDLSSYKMGKYLNENSGKAERIWSSNSFIGYPAYFYADRDEYQWKEVNNLKDFKNAVVTGNYKFYVIATDEINISSNREIFTFLALNYPFKLINPCLIFDLKNRWDKNRTASCPIMANVNDNMLFLGYDINSTQFKTGEKIILNYYWKCLGKIEKNYIIFVKFKNTKYENFCFYDTHKPLFGLYPTLLWKKGEIIKEKREVEIPAESLLGKYEILVSIGSYQDKVQIKGPLVKDDSWIKIGEIDISSSYEGKGNAKKQKTLNQIRNSFADKEYEKTLSVLSKIEKQNYTPLEREEVLYYINRIIEKGLILTNLTDNQEKGHYTYSEWPNASGRGHKDWYKEKQKEGNIPFNKGYLTDAKVSPSPCEGIIWEARSAVNENEVIFDLGDYCILDNIKVSSVKWADWAALNEMKFYISHDKKEWQLLGSMVGYSSLDENGSYIYDFSDFESEGIKRVARFVKIGLNNIEFKSLAISEIAIYGYKLENNSG